MALLHWCMFSRNTNPPDKQPSWHNESQQMINDHHCKSTVTPHDLFSPRMTLLLVLLFCVLSHLTLSVLHPRLLHYYAFVSDQDETMRRMSAATTRETPLPWTLLDALWNDSTLIRSWGCARNETPFVFVHIGKAGGGSVRARLAASALNYSRPHWPGYEGDSSYYYPIYDAASGSYRKGKMANSNMVNWMPPTLQEYHGDFLYEEWSPCAATTPLGQALACPMPRDCSKRRNHNHNKQNKSDDSKDDHSGRCDLVYMGHNVLGSELHWLPSEYLVNWWKESPWGQPDGTLESQQLLKELENRTISYEEGCQPPSYYRHPRNFPPGYYQLCVKPKQEALDQLACQVVLGKESNIHRHDNHHQQNVLWSHMISTLPVLRVTMVREPFSWLVSKFMWHTEHYSSRGNGTLVTTDRGPQRNMEQFIRNRMAGKPPPALPFVKCDDVEEAAHGWASFRALSYIMYLCGDHCWGQLAAEREELALASSSNSSSKSSLRLVSPELLQSIEQQAAYNLRHSFAVVGLLHKTQEFYQMISQRVSYMDTSLNQHVQGKQHSSNDLVEAQRCQKVFADPAFQAQLAEQSPAVAALQRLYQVAVDVNEFQQNELAQCSSA